MINRRFKILTLLAITILTVAVFSHAVPMKNEKELKAFLDKQAGTFEKIQIELGKKYWDFYTKDGEVNIEVTRMKLRNFLQNRELNRVVFDWTKKKNDIKDELLRARLHAWWQVLMIARVDMSEEVFNLQNKLENWMKEDNKDKYKPDDAGMQIKIIELIKLRNKKARELGYKDYVEFYMEVSGIGMKWYTETLSLLEKRTAEPYRKLIQELKQKKEIDKVDMNTILGFYRKYYMTNLGKPGKSAEIIEKLKNSLSDIGINYAELPVVHVDKELPPGIGGQGLSIDVPEDFRMVTVPSAFLDFIFHEMGHGLNSIYTKINLPIFEAYEWSRGCADEAMREGMAEVIARISRHPAWRKKYAGETDEEIKKRREIMRKYAPAYIRFQLLTIETELCFYRNPDADLVELRNKLLKKYVFADSEDNKPLRARGLIYVSYPVYIQNYLFGEIISWQIHRDMEKRFGADYIFKKEVRDYLIKYFYQDGELHDWQERLKMATGSKLDVEGYLKYLGI